MNTAFDKELLEANLEVIRNAYKLEYFNMEVLSAFICAAQGRTAEQDRLEACKKLMKSRHGVFSDFRGHLRLPLVVKMSLADDAEAWLQGVADTYDLLSASYKLGNESRLLAAMVIYENVKPEERGTVCEKTQEIYTRFRKSHPWLTNQEDMPFAALIAIQGGDADAKLEDTERCFRGIKESFKLSSNEMQTCSHILALSGAPTDEKVALFLRLYEGFKASKQRIGGYYLPILALLAALGVSPEDAIGETARHDAQLQKIKGFHGLLGMSAVDRRMFAASITALEHAGDGLPGIAAVTESAVMSAVLATILSIEFMIMMLVISSSTASASSSN